MHLIDLLEAPKKAKVIPDLPRGNPVPGRKYALPPAKDTEVKGKYRNIVKDNPIKDAKIEELTKELSKFDRRMDYAKTKEQYKKAHAEYHRIKQELEKINPKKTSYTLVKKLALRYWAILERDCKEFLSAAKKTRQVLYRGARGTKFPIYLGSPWKNRVSLDTPEEMQNSFDRILKMAGFEALRSNSIFCNPKQSETREYGETFLIVPLDGFKITWSEKFDDLYSSYLDYFESPEEMTNDLLYGKVYRKTFGQLTWLMYVWGERAGELRDNCAYKSENFEGKASDTENLAKQKEFTRQAREFSRQSDLYEAMSQLLEVRGTDFDVEDSDVHPIPSEAVKQIDFLLNKMKLYKTKYKLPLKFATNAEIEKLKILRKELIKMGSTKITPAVAKQAVNKLKMVNGNIEVALTKRREICLSGPYYAFAIDDAEIYDRDESDDLTVDQAKFFVGQYIIKFLRNGGPDL